MTESGAASKRKPKEREPEVQSEKKEGDKDQSHEGTIGEQTDNQTTTDEKPSPAAPPSSEENPDVSDMMRFSLDSPGGACVVSLSLLTLGLLSVHLSIPRQMVVVDSNLVDNDVVRRYVQRLRSVGVCCHSLRKQTKTSKTEATDEPVNMLSCFSMAALEEEDDDDDDAEECEGKKKLEVKSHQASHTKYLMMRGYCCPGIGRLSLHVYWFPTDDGEPNDDE